MQLRNGLACVQRLCTLAAVLHKAQASANLQSPPLQLIIWLILQLADRCLSQSCSWPSAYSKLAGTLLQSAKHIRKPCKHINQRQEAVTFSALASMRMERVTPDPLPDQRGNLQGAVQRVEVVW